MQYVDKRWQICEKFDNGNPISRLFLTNYLIDLLDTSNVTAKVLAFEPQVKLLTAESKDLSIDTISYCLGA